MSKLDFIKKLYDGKNCYSDHMSDEEMEMLHIRSSVESIVADMLDKGKIVFLTGNPGDGKTFIIKALKTAIEASNAYVQPDFNKITDYASVATIIASCYDTGQAALLAVNEYPFMLFCKALKEISINAYQEINNVKKNILTLDISHMLTGKIAIIDLNERNLLAADRSLAGELLDKFICLLSSEQQYDKTLIANVTALSIENVKARLIELFNLASVSCEHFSIRDILGAFSFILTACTRDDYEGDPYYVSIFNGTNPLLQAISQFDPIYLSIPSLDEQLWNGEITTGWQLDVPDKWPSSTEFDEDVEGAVKCFMHIKRKYYFENDDGEALLTLQPDEIKKCTEIFTSFEAQKKRIKEKLIRSINKLFLPSSDDRKLLHIWTTHRYDMSQEASIAVSSKAVDSSELELLMPRPADWLKGLEYVPNHVILKPKGVDKPRLVLDVNFLKTLEAVEEGYPVGLLAPQYEQSAIMFLQQLDDHMLAEENDDGEIIIASRKKSYKKTISIIDGKYDFEEVDQ